MVLISKCSSSIQVQDNSKGNQRNCLNQDISFPSTNFSNITASVRASNVLLHQADGQGIKLVLVETIEPIISLEEGPFSLIQILNFLVELRPCLACNSLKLPQTLVHESSFFLNIIIGGSFKKNLPVRF